MIQELEKVCSAFWNIMNTTESRCTVTAVAENQASFWPCHGKEFGLRIEKGWADRYPPNLFVFYIHNSKKE
jgi:hypothetical protein